VTLQAPPSRERTELFGIKAAFFVVSADRAQLIEIWDRLRITVSATYPLADGTTAYPSGTEPHRRSGKSVLVGIPQSTLLSGDG
jgi:hypothetical protein